VDGEVFQVYFALIIWYKPNICCVIIIQRFVKSREVDQGKSLLNRKVLRDEDGKNHFYTYLWGFKMEICVSFSAGLGFRHYTQVPLLFFVEFRVKTCTRKSMDLCRNHTSRSFMPNLIKNRVCNKVCSFLEGGGGSQLICETVVELIQQTKKLSIR
jgi:hypothetical protein